MFVFFQKGSKVCFNWTNYITLQFIVKPLIIIIMIVWLIASYILVTKNYVIILFGIWRECLI